VIRTDRYRKRRPRQVHFSEPTHCCFSRRRLALLPRSHGTYNLVTNSNYNSSPAHVSTSTKSNISGWPDRYSTYSRIFIRTMALEAIERLEQFLDKLLKLSENPLNLGCPTRKSDDQALVPVFPYSPWCVSLGSLIVHLTTKSTDTFERTMLIALEAYPSPRDFLDKLTQRYTSFFRG
jgi:hypothetical protein